MNFLSVCSGIEAASCAWNPLGWHAVAFSEIEPFPSAVLAHHYPNTPNLGDMTKYESWPHEFNGKPTDLLCGGTPCQSFSVAGLRKGLDDPRGNLMLTFGAIAAKYRPRWLVWENVPGVLSSNGGRDFGAFLGMLGQLGYGFAYRVLDAQYFGLAQRRKRVFVVGCLGDWPSAAAVLFERHSLQGHPAPRREKGQDIAPTIRAGAANGGPGHGARSGDSKDELIVAQCLTTGTGQRYDPETETETILPVFGWDNDLNASAESIGSLLRGGAGGRHEGVAYGLQANTIGRQPHNGGNGLGFSKETAPTLTKTDQHAVAAVHQPYTLAIRGRGDSHNLEYRQDGTSNALLTPTGGRSGIGVGAIAASMQVRRLTPRECERLQGFPDDYTAIAWRKKPASECPDGPRYKALGNSWAVPCARWIGERIAAVDQITLAPQQQAA
jgi:DNA (cytosine-5)-methyltransferase 1